MNPLSVLFIGQHNYSKDGCQQTFGNHTSGNYTNVMNKFNTTLMIVAITAPTTITTATTGTTAQTGEKDVRIHIQ